MPLLPTPHAAAALALTIVTIALFASARMRVELICLLVIAVLALGFYIFPLETEGRFNGMEVAFGGFSHEALVAICCLMILSRGLVVTGALEPVAHTVTRIWRFNRALGLLCSLLICGGLSLFINDTPVMVFTLPILLALAERSGIPAAQTLMPVNCAILIGGMATTIGTSTNLLIIAIAADLGMRPPGVFEFTPIALTAALVALPYLWLIMPRLLPSHHSVEPETPRKYDGQLHFTTSSVGVGQSLQNMRARLGSVEVLGIARHGQHLLDTNPTAEIQAGDRLHVRGSAAQLREASALLKAPLADPSAQEAILAVATQTREQQRIAEIVVGSDSTLVAHTVEEARLVERYSVAVLGRSRSDTGLVSGRTPTSEELAVGDVLLVHGTPGKLKELEIGEGVHLLDGAQELPHTSKAVWAVAIVIGVVAIAALKILPVAIAALAGVIAMLATQCIRFENIGRALSLEVIVLVAASIALGRALVETGAADWMGQIFASSLGSFPPAAVLAALMVFVTILTNFVSNAAAAGVATPIAFSIAQQLSIPAEPLVLGVLFGANLSYVTPMAYQTNLLIMGAARYRFSDFVRAGLPLAILMIVVLSVLLVRYYNL